MANTTEPIRDLSKVNEMRIALGNERDRMLFTLGINSGLRISDLVGLTIDDVKPEMELYEQKTGKFKRFTLSKSVYNMLCEYASKCKHWLFPSRSGDGHITTVQAWRKIKAASIKCGLDNIGTHSMRKTFGYHQYKNKKDVAMLMTLFNHASPDITLRYIGIQQDQQDKSMDDFYL